MVPAERHAVGAIRQGCARNDICRVACETSPRRPAVNRSPEGEGIVVIGAVPGAGSRLTPGSYRPLLIEGSAVRYHVRAELAGRLFEEFLLDVGFDFPTGWEPETLHGPDLLAFADIEPLEAPSLPLELQIAEKVHAYTRGYGQSGIASTRVKDLVDLALIASTARGSRVGGTIEPSQRLSQIYQVFSPSPGTRAPQPPRWSGPFRAFPSSIREFMA
jgi:Nucleotidyl transferase AbiEii toxin, Type IV TA system